MGLLSFIVAAAVSLVFRAFTLHLFEDGLMRFDLTESCLFLELLGSGI
jgi:hypothetical protein